jgi:hypothetical protein
MKHIRKYLLVLMVCAGCQSQPPVPTTGAGSFAAPKDAKQGKPLFTLPEVVTSVPTKAGLWLLVYAFNGDALSYAVITGPSVGEVHGHSHSGGDSTGKLWAYVDKPDGTEISVLNSGRIFFFSTTNFAECPQHISGKTFRDFLDSQPSDYSISALLRFAEEHK